MFLLGMAPGLLNATLVLFYLYKRPPKFLDEKTLPKWNRISIITWISAMVATIVGTMLWSSKELFPYQIFAGLGASTMAAAGVVGIFTDFHYRLVDRHFLRIEIFALMIPGIFYLFCVGPDKIIVYLVFLIAVSAFIYLPFYGESDGRMMLIVALSLVPISSYYGPILSYSLAMVSIFIYSIPKFFRRKETAKFRFISAEYSIPAVPFFAFSGLIVLFAIPFLGFLNNLL